MFIDEATIRVRAGSGGNGCIAFRREKFVPKGGPSGGDGGHGGDVILLADPNLRTLLSFRHQTLFAAGNGLPGLGKEMFGRRGADCVVRLPVGTIVQDQGGRTLADFVDPARSLIVARGGRGGKGNVHFKSATRRAPRIATEGRPGAELELHLTLKLFADVGLVGLPNVGKSTLLRRLSNATPKIGDYAFTTLEPHLGIVPLGDYDSFVMADLPGLIEGAHEGRGLGARFLRHIERTRLLLILIDSASADPLRDVRTLLHELGSFSPALLRRPRVFSYSRADLAPKGDSLPALDESPLLCFSAATGDGIPELLSRLREALEVVRKPEADDWPDDFALEAAGGEAGDDGPAGEAGHRTRRAFADLVDEGVPLGRFPWPRRFYLETPETRDVAARAMGSTEARESTEEDRASSESEGDRSPRDVDS